MTLQEGDYVRVRYGVLAGEVRIVERVFTDIDGAEWVALRRCAIAYNASRLERVEVVPVK